MELPADPTILEFYEEFVDTWIGDINDQWDGFLATKNSQDFYRFAHTLKGSGYQFSITPLGDTGIELMRLIKEEQWDVIPPYKEKLLSILQEAKQLYLDSINK
jgi:hypothetical protein